MRKFFSLCLVFGLLITQSANVYAYDLEESYHSNETFPVDYLGTSTIEFNQDNVPCKVTRITDKNEIAKYAEEMGIENNGDIVEIVDKTCENLPTIEPNINNTIDSPTTYSTRNYYYIDDIRSSVEKGQLLHSSTYRYPGGSMTVEEEISASVHGDFGVSVDILTASLGFDVTKTYRVKDTHNIEVPKGQMRTLDAYVKLHKYTYNVWRKKSFSTNSYKKLGRGMALRPVGVTFVVRNTY